MHQRMGAVAMASSLPDPGSSPQRVEFALHGVPCQRLVSGGEHTAMLASRLKLLALLSSPTRAKALDWMNRAS